MSTDENEASAQAPQAEAAPADDRRRSATASTETPEASEAAALRVVERVGRGYPPLATRFRPGRSGNPRGRPRRKRHLGAVVAAALRERVTVEETGGRVRRLSKLEATVKQIVDGATKGDARAIKLLFALIKADERALTEAEGGRPGQLASEADAIVIAELRRRLGAGRPSGAKGSTAEPSPPTPLPQGERGEARRSSLPSVASSGREPAG